MKKIPVKLLKPGLCFSEPVYVDGKNILVPAGIPIRQKDLDNLGIWGVETVQTRGLPSFAEDSESKKSLNLRGKPLSAEKAPVQNQFDAAGKPGSALSLSDVSTNSSTYQTYISLIEQLDVIFTKIASKIEIIDTSPISMIGTRLLQAVRTERGRYIGFILGGEVRGLEMAKSSVNTAILSFLVAQALKFPHHRILNTVIGSLLHDVGMLRIPSEVREKRGGLSDAERRLINSHPLISRKIATKDLKFSDEVGSIIVEHHERWDGGGYPNRIAGERIDSGARIVSIADAFEAMVCPKPYRTSMSGYQANKNLLADNSRRFDPGILKIFIMTMGIYPLGSMVRLNNGAVARIAEIRPETPLRPKIQVLIDEQKKEFANEEGAVLDLLLEKNLYIAKAIEPKELL